MNKIKVNSTTLKTKKKIKKESSGIGIINSKFSFNNTIVNLARTNGQVLTQVSAGTLGYKNTKKSTPFVAQKCAEKIISLASEFGIQKAELNVKGMGSGRDIVIRKILSSESISITALVDKTPEKHGGCRARKAPRK